MLATYASELPEELRAAFASEARRIGLALPALVYVSAPTPLCFTASDFRSAKIYVSRGFLDGLGESDLRLLAHHELVHVRDHHATWNVFWHIAFATMVLPGIDGVEARFGSDVKSMQTSRLRGSTPNARNDCSWNARERRALCFEGTRGVRPRIADALAPLAVLAFFVALFILHVDFMHDLPYLASHHC